jgi:hypothetical protein
MAITTNVYGRRNASRTIHIEILPAWGYLLAALCGAVLITGEYRSALIATGAQLC